MNLESTRQRWLISRASATNSAAKPCPARLPVGQNSPQKAPYGLYTELFSGTAFTMARSEARRTWMYRIQPSANHPAFVKLERQLAGGPLGEVTPNRLRWNPLDIPGRADRFHRRSGEHGGQLRRGKTARHQHLSLPRQPLDGARVLQCRRRTVAGAASRAACALPPSWACWKLEPLEIAVLPRGLKFRVELLDPQARGYVAENHGAPLRLPDLGPIGSNGLANPRDFLTPVAALRRPASSQPRWCRNSSVSCGAASSIIRR